MNQRSWNLAKEIADNPQVDEAERTKMQALLDAAPEPVGAPIAGEGSEG